MARRNSKLKTIMFSIVCLFLGFVIGAIGQILFTLPDSYKIPKKVEGSRGTSLLSGDIDSNVINNSDLSIHFLELGNKYTGDCVYIKVGDVDILVDGGSKTSSSPFITEYVDNYFTDNVLDYVIITHAHEDHYAGYATNEDTESLFDYYTSNGNSITNIITFAQTKKSESNKMHKNYLRELGVAIAKGSNHYSVLDCWEGKTIEGMGTAQKVYNLGTDSDGNNIEMQFLYTKFYTEAHRYDTSTENDYSVCFQIVQGEKIYLFTGDLEKEGEESLVDNNSNLKEVELYKAGHHGSKTSSTEDFMSVIKPKIVVVCCCAGSSEYTSKNENQFPTQEFVNNTSIYTDKIYVTTLCIDYAAAKFESFNGTVAVCSTGNGNNTTSVLCSNNTTVLKDSEWFKKNRTLPQNAVGGTITA